MTNLSRTNRKKKLIFKSKYIYLLVMLFFFICSCSNEQITSNDGSSNLPQELITDVEYNSNAQQVFDIHLPAHRDSNTPVILMIHGGSWKGGDKEDFDSYIELIKDKWDDVAIVNMNYRLASNSNNIHHNEIIEDINSVVQYIISNHSNYHISNKIGVVGASAGGQLAMIYAYKYNSNIKCVGDIFGPSIISDWSWYNSTNLVLGDYVGNILTEYVGQPWNQTVYKEVSPFWNVTSASQPTIIFHGNLDPVVPVYQSQWLHGKLDDLGVVNQYHEYVAFHGFDENQSNEVIDKLVSFFKVHIE